MLTITQPLRVGDWVTFEDHYGVVEDVRLNFTVLRTLSEQRIVIPNERLASGVLRNDTLETRRRRARRLALAAGRRRRPARARRPARGDGPVGDHRRDRAPRARGWRSAASGCHRPSAPSTRRSCASSACAGCARTGCSATDRAIPRARARDRSLPAKADSRLYTRRSAAAPGGTRMSLSQRTRLRRSHRGSPRNKALLGLLVVVVLVGHRRHRRRRLRGLDRRLRAVAVLAEGARPRLELRGARRRRLAGSASSRPPSCACPPRATSSRRCSRTPRSRSRTAASTSTRASTTRASSAPACRTSSTRRPCRAARRSRCSSPATSTSPSERTYERKIREAKVAEEIENEHSKEWILDKYLNTVPYGTVGGQSAIGAKAAARIYFNKRLGQLTLREAALLAGLPQAPVAVLAAAQPRAPPRRAATTCCARWRARG